MIVPAPEPQTLSRAAPDDPAVDFAALRAEAAALVERTAGSIWTDYNEHDPGITLLEALCYALTELGYRADFPVEDLLAPAEGIDRILLPPARAYSTEPVTLADYRRLLIDRVPGLANAWLETQPAETSGGTDGLYMLWLYESPEVPGIHRRGEPDGDIARRAARVYARHRALCEDLGAAALLRPVRTRVEAELRLAPGHRAEAVVALAVQRLACWLAPEPRRRPLRALLADGRSLADIFDGPRLVHGFIDEADLGPRRSDFDPAELRLQLAGVPGVEAVGPVRVTVRRREYGEGERCTIAEHECFSLDSGLDRNEPGLAPGEDSTGRAFDSRDAVRRLKALWSAHRQRHRLAPELHRLLLPPRGRPRNFDHVPVAEDLPRIYGVGRDGVPASAPEQRKVQARQLRDYLGLFDRVMEDYLRRLAELPAAILGSEAAPESSLAEQERMADFLLELHGEALAIPLPPGLTSAESGRRRLAVKRELISALPSLARTRGRGFDYLRRRWRRLSPGVELRARILLGGRHDLPRRLRPRLIAIEHVLLRPRTGEWIGPLAATPRIPRGLSLTMIVHLPEGAEQGAYGRAVEACLRQNTPAHIDLFVHFVGRDSWVRFRRLQRLWRRALRDDLSEAADLLAQEMLARFELWEGEGGPP